MVAGAAQLLVSDDADGCKAVTDELGLAHQVEQVHIRRNTEELVANLQRRIIAEPNGSLVARGGGGEQAQADLTRPTELIQPRPVEGSAESDHSRQRYTQAHPPQDAAKATVAYQRVRHGPCNVSQALRRWAHSGLGEGDLGDPPARCAPPDAAAPG